MTSPQDLTTLANAKSWIDISVTTDDALLARLITATSADIQKWLGRRIRNQAYSEVFDGEGNAQIVFPQYPCTSVQSLAIDTQPIAASADGGILQSGYGFDWDRIWVVGSQFTRSEWVTEFTRGRGNIQIAWTAGYLVGATNASDDRELYPPEAQTIPSGTPWQIAVTSLAHPWAQDTGVKFSNGAALVKVPSAPTTGQYTVSLVNGMWTYTFAAADAGRAVLMYYAFVPESVEQACIEMVAWKYRMRKRIGLKSESLGGEVTSYDISALPDYIMAAIEPYRRVAL